MKKIFLILLVLIVAGCTSNNNASNTVNDDQIKPYMYINRSTNGSETHIYTYNGNKLVVDQIQGYDVNTTVTSNYVMKYFYQGDLLTVEQRFDVHNTLTHEVKYFYDVNNQYLLRKIVYNYTTPSVTVTRYEYTIVSGQEYIEKGYDGLVVDPQAVPFCLYDNIIQDGQLISQFFNRPTPTGSESGSMFFTYDDKKSPFKNVVGITRNALGTYPLHNVGSINGSNIQNLYNDQGYLTKSIIGTTISEFYY